MACVFTPWRCTATYGPIPDNRTWTARVHVGMVALFCVGVCVRACVPWLYPPSIRLHMAQGWTVEMGLCVCVCVCVCVCCVQCDDVKTIQLHCNERAVK